MRKFTLHAFSLIEGTLKKTDKNTKVGKAKYITKSIKANDICNQKGESILDTSKTQMEAILEKSNLRWALGNKSDYLSFLDYDNKEIDTFHGEFEFESNLYTEYKLQEHINESIVLILSS